MFLLLLLVSLLLWPGIGQTLWPQTQITTTTAAEAMTTAAEAATTLTTTITTTKFTMQTSQKVKHQLELESERGRC